MRFVTMMIWAKMSLDWQRLRFKFGKYATVQDCTTCLPCKSQEKKFSTFLADAHRQINWVFIRPYSPRAELHPVVHLISKFFTVLIITICYKSRDITNNTNHIIILNLVEEGVVNLPAQRGMNTWCSIIWLTIKQY